MAMLAEPRRKKRSLNLRGNNNWSDDPNKFGQKMMQKMGWTPGKGLGLNEDGKVDNVKVRFKDDNNGVGFTDRNDQWTSHEASFEELLRNLHGGHVDRSKLHSESSLEEKSKKLQSRLHYKKFTRGKDITQYSQKDLANIFGKKTLNTVENKPINDVVVISEETVEDSKLVGGGSMTEYFQSKMKNKCLSVPSQTKKFKENVSDEEDSGVAFQGFSASETFSCGNGLNDDERPPKSVTSLYNNFISFNQSSTVHENTENEAAVIKTKKKKKSKSNKFESVPLVDEVSMEMVSEEVITFLDEPAVEELKKKKLKKNKKMVLQNQESPTDSETVTKVATKKKKNKQHSNCTDIPQIELEDIINISDTEEVPNKKKQKASREKIHDLIEETVVLDEFKHKKRKSDDRHQCLPSKKKKKDCELHQNVISKKSKKKNKLISA